MTIDSTVDATLADRFPVPGTELVLDYTRDRAGRLVELRCGDRVHLRVDGDTVLLGDGLAGMTVRPVAGGADRTVRAAGRTWTEQYRWDAAGRLSHVDGVDVLRDGRARVVSCLDRTTGAAWRYGYAGADLAVIDGPRGVRHLTSAAGGRPVLRRAGGVRRPVGYDADGRRTGCRPAPAGWRRDAAGRLWTVRGPDGGVAATYLWDGFRCLGRIDGPPDGPLAVAYCLDPSGTPVRVVEAGRVRRLPRDAFGEGLLGACDVGLFGGPVAGDLVHLPARAVDPRLGAFTEPDPFDGGPHDPRRLAGARDDLAVEVETAGRYAVCRHDPVGRTDPTGAISAWLPISTLTWSLSNTTLALFGVDFTLNFWGSLFSGKAGEFFGTFEGVTSSDRVGSFGIHRDGVLGLTDKAWTLQHHVFADTKELWNPHRTTRVLAPAPAPAPGVPPSPYRPSLYGTLLRLTPSDGAPELLRGDGQLASGAGLRGWTRSGGPAAPAVPGSLTPTFPAGGIHLDNDLGATYAPQPGSLAELAGVGTPVTGTLTTEPVLLAAGVTSVPAALVAGLQVVVTLGSQAVVLSTVQAATATAVGLEIDLAQEPTAPSSDSLRLRGVGPVISTEQLGTGTAANRLNVAGATGAYAVDDVLLLSRGGTPEGAVLVTALDARLTLEEALPATLATAPFTVTVGVPTPATPPAANTATVGADGTSLDFATGPAAPPIPGRGDTILVTAGANSRAMGVTAAGATPNRPVDAALAPLGGPGTAVVWQPLTPGTGLGSRAGARETGTALTYTPDAPHTAPAGGFVIVSDAGSPSVRTARRVIALGYDEVVCGQPLPVSGPAPYDVARHPFADPDVPGVTVASRQVVTTGTPFGTAAPGAAAVRAQQYPVPDLDTLAAPGGAASYTVSVAGTLASTSDARTGFPRPGQVAVLTGAGGPAEGVLVAGVRVTYQFDRDVGPGSGPAPTGTEPLVLTRLTESGPRYRAARVDDRTVTVLPQVDVALPGPPPTTAPSRTQLPRLRPGELVRVFWQLLAIGDSADHTVTAVDGTTLTLHPTGRAIPALATAVTVRRLAPVGNGDTGALRLGLAGERPDPAGAPTRITFSVWRPDGIGVNAAVALSDGTVTRVARVAAILPGWQIDLAAAPSRHTGAGVTLLVPGAPSAEQFSARFTVAGAEVTLADRVATSPLPPVTGSSVVLLTGFAPDLAGPTPPAPTQGVNLSSGGVRVPEADEDFEIDRLQSLIDHELTHTKQSAKWGPLLFGLFPLFLVDLGMELSTGGGELPKFSPYVSGTLAADGPGRRVLSIPSPGTTTFGTGDQVQVSLAGTSAQVVRLGEAAGANRFLVNPAGQIADGDVAVRKQLSQADVWTYRVFSFIRILTAGGALDAGAGSVWGSLFWLLGKGFYALGRLIGGSGDRYPATVQENGAKIQVTLDATDAAKREKVLTAFRGVSQVTVQQGETTLVRGITATAGTPELLELDPSVTLSGEVQVAPYSTHTPGSFFDWYDYYPASVTEADRPAAVKVEPVGGKTLELRPHDRVEVQVGKDSFRTYVTAVQPGGNVELLDPVLTASRAERQLRIAKISSTDPMGWADSWVLENLGMGWMRWAFDFYGQLNYRTAPDLKSAWGIVSRIGRYLLGAKAWSMAPPAFGYFFWDNGFRRGEAYLSQMEQEASEESGSLYSAIGRLRVQPQSVGDVGRYWFFTDEQSSLVSGGRFEAPGVALTDSVRLIPLNTAELPDSSDPPRPNNGSATPAAAAAPEAAAPGLPGGAVPDAFVAKVDGDLRQPAAAGPASFAPSDRGWIPQTPITARAAGMHVAFCAPGPHRIGVRDDIDSTDGASHARTAQDKGAQELFYDVTVTDLAVSVGGLLAAEGGTVTLVQTQRAAVSVAGGGADAGERVYVATTTRPAGSPTVRTDADGTVLVARPQNTTAAEPVEVSRLYRAGADGRYTAGGLAGHTVHLGGDLHVPVRSFAVQVTDTLPVRSAAAVDPADPTGNAVTEAHPGDSVFLVVPAAGCGSPTLDPPTFPDGSAAPVHPVVTPLADADIPDALRPVLGDGAVYRIEFPPAENPAQPVTVTVRATTWIPAPGILCTDPAAVRATLRATLSLLPA